MSGSPGTGGSNPRKFSEKIALHNQKQAEETRAFDQLMTDLNVSRLQFQKIQQLRLSQTRAPYYGGSLPNVNQIGNASNDFQGGFPLGLDSVRGTRHHGLVERVHRNRINAPLRRPLDKHGRQISFTHSTAVHIESSPYATAYLSPPPDNNWRRTNSDSALHTSVMNPNGQDPFGVGQQMGRGPPQRPNAGGNEVEVDGTGDVFSFPSLSNEEGLLGVSKPLPKQLWEAKVQSLASRPKSCEVPGINIFPSPEQNPGLSHYQGSLSQGGSLPDLTNLHFPSPLSTPLDPEDNGGYPNLSGGSSTGNLPAAMMHLGIGNTQGLSSSLSNPSIQASLSTSQMHMSLSNPSIHSSLRMAALPSPPPPAGLNSSPRRRPAPISPLTLSPGAEQRRGLAKQLSPTMSPSLSPITQQQHQQQQQQQQQQPSSPVNNIPLEFTGSPQNLASFFSDPFLEQQFSSRQDKALSYQFEQYSLLESVLNSAAGGSCFDPSPPPSGLFCPQGAHSGLSGSRGNLHDPLNTRSNMLYSNCGGGVPNIILTDESNLASLSKDLSSALSDMSECFDTESGFPLEDELRIEPLSLDGLTMLSNPDMVLPDPSVEDTFRSDRL
ncbi:unnamed protein product [Arctogadus glacialis]